MQKLLFAFVISLFLVSSCKKEEPPPQPVAWDEDWVVFTGTFYRPGPDDTITIGFSSNQGCSGIADAFYSYSLMPMNAQATYSSEFVGGPASFKVTRGKLPFTGYTMGDKPADSSFINYFRSGYYTISENAEDGFSLVYATPDEVWSTDEHIDTYGPPTMYTCRISDYHPFMRNGIQHVKVKMHFENVGFASPLSPEMILLSGDYESFLRNE